MPGLIGGIARWGGAQGTGLDPEGVALRASEGLAAVDFLMPGYFVWGRIIEALADIGYDQNTVVPHSAPRTVPCRCTPAVRSATWPSSSACLAVHHGVHNLRTAVE